MEDFSIIAKGTTDDVLAECRDRGVYVLAMHPGSERLQGETVLHVRASDATLRAWFDDPDAINYGSGFGYPVGTLLHYRPLTDGMAA